MNNYIEIGHLMRSVRRWWWIIIVLVVVASVSGYMISVRLSPIYEATATILVGQGTQATELSRDDILIRDELVKNYADIAKRQPVLQGVVDALDLDENWRQLRKRVSVKVVADTHLLEIMGEANSPGEAEMVAAELAQQLILMSPTNPQKTQSENKQPFVKQQLEFLQAKIEEGQEKITVLEASLEPSLTTDELTQIQSEINTLETSITEWTKSYTQFLTIVENKNQLNYLTIIEPAQSSTKPVWPHIQLNILISAGLGLILGLGLTFLLEYLDNTIKSTDDLKQTMGVKPLGTIHSMDGKDYENKLITDQAPLSSLSEAFRLIRSNIELITYEQPGNVSRTTALTTGELDKDHSDNSQPIYSKAIAVTSPGMGEGKSVTVANLGIIMAQADFKTVIVDANLRKPIQHQLFQVENTGGVAEILRTPEFNAQEQLTDTNVENLKLLTSGALPNIAIDLLRTQRIQKVLDDLFEIADIVIMDCPPIIDFPEAVVLSKQADGVIMVIEAGKTTHNDVEQAFSNLETTGANLMGVILNRVSKRKSVTKYDLHQSEEKEEDHERQSAQVETRRRWKWLPGNS